MRKRHRTPVAALVQCTHSDLWATRDPADYCIQVVKSCGLFDHVVLAVPDIPENDIFEDLARAWDVKLFRGAEFDVAQRLADAAAFFGVKHVARVLLKRFYLDVDMVREMLDLLISTGADHVALPTDFNYELAADVLSVSALRQVAAGVQGNGFEESVRRFSPWGYIEGHPEIFSIVEFTNLPVYPKEKVNAIKEKYRRVLTFESSAYGRGFPASRYHFVADSLGSDDVVLDIACGRGEGALIMSSRVGEVVGVDHEATFLNDLIARRDCPDNVSFTVCDAEEFVDKGRFDVAVTLHTMEHLSDDEKFLKNLWRSLKPGGRLILEVPLLMPKPLGEPLLPIHLREYLLPDLKQLITNNGFAIQRVWGGNRNRYTNEQEAREVVHIHAIKVER